MVDNWYDGLTGTRPGITVTLGAQNFVLPLSCRAVLAILPLWNHIQAAWQRGDGAACLHFAIQSAQILLSENHPEITVKMLLEHTTPPEIYTLISRVGDVTKPPLPPIEQLDSVDAGQGIPVRWASEMRFVPLLSGGDLQDLITRGLDQVRLFTEPGLTAVLGVVHQSMSRRYEGLTLDEVSENFTLLSLRQAWFQLFDASTLHAQPIGSRWSN